MENEKLSLPQFLPLPEAAKKLGISERELLTRIEAGTIPAGTLPNGEIAVSIGEDHQNQDLNSQLRAIKRDDFEYLSAELISISEAERKYGVSGWTLRNWIERDYIATDTTQYPMKLNEADIAYCVAIQEIRKTIGVRSGAPLLDPDGNPYLLKHPSLSRYRRENKKS